MKPQHKPSVRSETELLQLKIILFLAATAIEFLWRDYWNTHPRDDCLSCLLCCQIRGDPLSLLVQSYYAPAHAHEAYLLFLWRLTQFIQNPSKPTTNDTVILMDPITYWILNLGNVFEKMSENLTFLKETIQKKV